MRSAQKRGKRDMDSFLWKPIDVSGERFVYRICENGKIIKASKKRCVESYVATYMRRGKLHCKIANKDYVVKHLVASAFIKGYKKGLSVCHKDGNPHNCKADNLTVFSKAQLGKITGGESRRKPVMINGTEYYSMREGAKALHCSYQTLSDYLNGKVSVSVLDGLDVNYI